MCHDQESGDIWEEKTKKAVWIDDFYEITRDAAKVSQLERKVSTSLSSKEFSDVSNGL